MNYPEGKEFILVIVLPFSNESTRIMYWQSQKRVAIPFSELFLPFLMFIYLRLVAVYPFFVHHCDKTSTKVSWIPLEQLQTTFYMSHDLVLGRTDKHQSWHPYCGQLFQVSFFVGNIVYPFTWDLHWTRNLTHFYSSVTYFQVVNFIHDIWNSEFNMDSTNFSVTSASMKTPPKVLLNRYHLRRYTFHAVLFYELTKVSVIHFLEKLYLHDSNES